jgi:hypothetical protein
VPELTLVSNIVNGKERPNPVIAGLLFVDLAQVNRRQAGLPIVQMEDTGPVIEQADCLQDCPVKEDEAFTVVGVIALLPAGKC